MVATPSYSVEEAALELDTDEELVRAAAARLGLERFRGVYAITPDELAAIGEELGIASVLDEDSDDEDSDGEDSDDEDPDGDDESDDDESDDESEDDESDDDGSDDDDDNDDESDDDESDDDESDDD